MEDEEEKIISRDTLIIEFIKDNKKFICNRNPDTYKYICKFLKVCLEQQM